MIYISGCFWLLVAVLLAWAVHHLWTSMTKPRALDLVLFPGTLGAEVGRIVGLLITGATLSEGGDGAGAAPRPKMPVIGPLMVALVPLILLCTLIYLVASQIGTPIVAGVPKAEISPELPVTLTGFWAQLRGLITLSEGTLNAIQNASVPQWQVWCFVYLMISLTVHLAPVAGNLRGHLGAVLAVGVTALLAGTLVPSLPDLVAHSWPVLSFTVGWLLLLLFISLVARAAVSSVQMILKWQ